MNEFDRLAAEEFDESSQEVSKSLDAVQTLLDDTVHEPTIASHNLKDHCSHMWKLHTDLEMIDSNPEKECCIEDLAHALLELSLDEASEKMKRTSMLQDDATKILNIILRVSPISIVIYRR
jgi:hypothetical protein